MKRDLLRGALWVAFWVGLAWALSPALDRLDAHVTPAWSVPPFSIMAITAASASPQVSEVWGCGNRLTSPRGCDVGSSPAPQLPRMGQPAETLRLPGGSVGPMPALKPDLGRSAQPPATPGPAASHALAGLVRVGTASFYDAGPGMYAALPGPWRAGRWVQVCGPAKCEQAPVVTSCVCGGHVIDLSPSLWEAVSGMNTVERWRYGVTSVSIVIEGGKP